MFAYKALDFYEKFDSPELKLCRAIINRAIFDSCLVNQSRRNNLQQLKNAELERARLRRQKEVRRWFRSSLRHPFSFLWLCDQLGYTNIEIRRLKKYARVQ